MEKGWRVDVAETAANQIAAIRERRIQKQILTRIRELDHDPEKQGKALVGPLLGYYSVRAAEQRYRIIYTVDRGVVTVHVVAVGIRRAGAHDDVYELAKKLVKRGLLES